jgi:cytochrome c
MKRFLTLTVSALVLVCFAFTGAALADQRADVKALVESAVAMAKEKGIDATLAAVKDKNGPFVKGKLYIYAGSTEKNILIAHPMAPQIVGKNQAKMRDVKGKYFNVEMMNVARGPGQGWVSYWWPRPGEKKASEKEAFIMRVPNEKVWFGCGYYK